MDRVEGLLIVSFRNNPLEKLRYEIHGENDPVVVWPYGQRFIWATPEFLEATMLDLVKVGYDLEYNAYLVERGASWKK